MIVGIDVGGTKTHIVLSTPDADDFHVVVGTATWQRSHLFGDNGNAARLVSLLREHVAEELTSPLVIGAHGCDTEHQCSTFREQISACYAGPVSVLNDAELVGPAAGIAEPVISVIVGTGSIVVGRSPLGERLTVGGHGWLLGDPGSAPALVREAIRMMLVARDAGAPRDLMAERFMHEYGVNDEIELSYVFSTDPSITSWGRLAPVVFECADLGSTLAWRVIDSAAARLAQDVARAVSLGAVGQTVIVAGGVAVNQPHFFEAFRRHLVSTGLEHAVKLLEIAPVYGALEIARKMTAQSTTVEECNGHQQQAS